MKKPKVTSITVCRKGSVRIKDKWSSSIGDKTLIERKIETLKNCSYIDNVVVGSNVSQIQEICTLNDVTHYWRDEYHCDESKCSANDMIYDMCKKVKGDIILWAHCTNPLVSSNTYDKAISLFLKKEAAGYDSLLSVDLVQEHLWGNDKRPLNYNPYAKTHVLASRLPALYKQNGAIFIQRREDFVQNKYFFGKTPYLMVLEKSEGLDINEMIDLKIANLILSELGDK